MVRREMAVLSVESLPLGFRFRPTDVELVNHYLKGKISGRIKSEFQIIPEIDICKWEPWDLPDQSLIKSSDPEWFFFAPKDRKYPTGNRAKRATNAGYWKATGKDRTIKSKAPGSPIIGLKKTLVFYQGRAPNGVRTTWIMHEYRTNDPEIESREQGGFVLFRLFKKSEDRTEERTANDIDGGGLSPAPMIISPVGMEHGVQTTEEPVTPLDQKPPVLVLQENSQSFPLTSDVLSSDVSDLLADQLEAARVYPSNQEESNGNITVFSDAAEHETDVTNEILQVNFSLDEIMQYLGPESEKLLSNDFNFSPSVQPGVVNYGDADQRKISEFNQYECTDEDSVTAFLDSVLCDPDECSPGVLSTSRGATNMHVPVEQNYVISDYSSLPLHSVKEGIGFSSEICEPRICLNNVPHGFGQHAIPNQNWSQNVSSTSASPFHDELVEMDNFDSGIIQIRRNRKISDSTHLIDQQGLMANRIRLQKFVHKGSEARTDHVLSTTNDNLVQSVVSQVREITEHQFNEEKTASRLIHADAVSTPRMSSSETCGEPNVLRSRNKQRHKDDDSVRNQSLDPVATSAISHATIRIILILSALLFFILVGLNWCLSS